MRLPSLLARFVHDPHLLEGRSRLVAAAAHDQAVAIELALSRALDAVAPPPRVPEPLLQELTVLIKTFERPTAVRRLVDSIRRLYPVLRIVVADDSRQPVELDGVDVVRLPYDSGVGAGRNAGLDRIETKFAFVLDDDYVFFRKTRLRGALDLLAKHPEIDIMGGQLVDLPLFTQRAVRDAAGKIYATAARPRVPIGTFIAGLEVVEKVPTFFLARRDSLARVGWDSRLKRVDHADFFTRAFGVLTTVFNPEFKCFHARTPFDRDYMAKRLDVAESRALLAKRYDG